MAESNSLLPVRHFNAQRARLQHDLRIQGSETLDEPFDILLNVVGVHYEVVVLVCIGDRRVVVRKTDTASEGKVKSSHVALTSFSWYSLYRSPTSTPLGRTFAGTEELAELRGASK